MDRNLDEEYCDHAVPKVLITERQYISVGNIYDNIYLSCVLLGAMNQK